MKKVRSEPNLWENPKRIYTFEFKIVVEKCSVTDQSERMNPYRIQN